MNLKNILTPVVRRWLYGVAIAFVPVAVLLGWLKPEAVPVILPLIMAVFFVNDAPKSDLAPTTHEPDLDVNGDGL